MSWLVRLWRDPSGVAATEAALILPFFLGAGLWAVELANYSLTTMRVGQLAIHIADNASRIGDNSTLENRKIYERDLNDLLLGASLQGGEKMGIYDHGRVIISSLEENTAGQQYIHWQRCMGKKNVISSYGNTGDIKAGGMGPAGRTVIAPTGEAVIFVEMQYDYQPLISDSFVGTPTIKSIASFIVRDSRDLSQIYQVAPASPDPVHTCNAYDNALD